MSRLFRVDTVELEFANGERRSFEQLVSENVGGVVVVPISGNDLLLIEEYALGIGTYELGFVKGAVDHGESPETAARRELQEETGFAAGRIDLMETVTLMPAYSNFKSHIYLARDLSIDPLPGDEPEPLEQHLWPICRINELHRHPAISDARTRLCLYLLESRLNDLHPI
ncbi:MAG: ADP compounds hydrolase NudE [marine bacterium B5-7]|nr:MAG: ADP compounds hydrolase NudE [marine bacterium B5-7]